LKDVFTISIKILEGIAHFLNAANRVYKVVSPPRRGVGVGRIKLFGKKIKCVRRVGEGKREE